MLYSLTGTLVARDMDAVAVDCSGVAYYCKTTLSTLSRMSGIGEAVTLYTYLNIRQEALELFGFADMGELNCFKMLINVSGVGPKAALSILSTMTPERFALCVASGDYKAITAAPGVGSKLAQRVVLELKDKLGKADIAAGFADTSGRVVVAGKGNAGEAMSALMVLGYSQSEAAVAIGGLEESLPVEELIKGALKKLASL